MIPSYIQDFVDFAVEKAFQEALRSMQGAPGMGTLHRFSKRSCMQRILFLRLFGLEMFGMKGGMAFIDELITEERRGLYSNLVCRTLSASFCRRSLAATLGAA